MGTKEPQKRQPQIIFKKSDSLKRILQFLLPISIFSFVFSYSPLITCFQNSFSVIYSTYFSHLCGYFSDRKLILFLCHGILVFLLGDSGFLGSFPSKKNLYDGFYMNNGDSLPSGSEFSESKVLVVEKKQQQQQKHEEKEGEKQQQQQPQQQKHEEEEGEKQQQQQQQQQKHEEEEGEKQQQQQQHQHEEEEGLFSNEEMNIRFEELKRRVTEERRIVAHQLRLMV